MSGQQHSAFTDAVEETPQSTPTMKRRGRPPKARSLGEMDVSLYSTTGRTPKSDGIKRSRGRPKKPVDPNPPPKRPRGRPPKVKAEEGNESIHSIKGDVDTNSIDRENVNPKKKRKLEVADENIGESPNKIATSGKTTKRPVSIKFPRPNSNKELPSQQKVVQNASVSSSMDVDNVFEPEISKNTPLDELIKIAEKDFQFKRHLPVSLTESCFEHYAKNNSLVFYKKNNMVGVNDDEKVAGDRIYYRCVNWELTRCQLIGCGLRCHIAKSSRLSFTYYQSGEHSPLCFMFKMLEKCDELKSALGKFDPLNSSLQSLEIGAENNDVQNGTHSVTNQSLLHKRKMVEERGTFHQTDQINHLRNGASTISEHQNHIALRENSVISITKQARAIDDKEQLVLFSGILQHLNVHMKSLSEKSGGRMIVGKVIRMIEEYQQKETNKSAAGNCNVPLKQTNSTAAASPHQLQNGHSFGTGKQKPSRQSIARACQTDSSSLSSSNSLTSSNMGIQTDENAQKEPEKVKTTEFGAQIELEIATPIPVKPHEMGAAITQATQTPDNINELDLAPMFLAAFDFEELPAQEEELLPKLTPLKRPPKPEPFSIIGRLEDGLKQLAHDLAITCNAIGEQVMFFHQSGTIAVAQYGEENLVSISAAKMSIPYGPLIVWKALDWDQFEFALRGHLSNAFYDSPRATTEHELQEKGEPIPPLKQRVHFPIGEITEEDLGDEFSLRNWLTNESFEDLAEDLSMEYEQNDHGFSLTYARRNIRLQFTDYADQHAIRLEEFEDGELVDDISWLKLGHSQFLDAVRGRALKLVYGSPREPIDNNNDGGEEDEYDDEEEEGEENGDDEEQECDEAAEEDQQEE